MSKIELGQWLAIMKLSAAVRAAVNALDDVVVDTALTHARAGNVDESTYLLKLSDRYRDILLPLGLQSEWLGGPPDEPKNHTLREPYGVPGPQRKYTREELAACGVEFYAPCQYIVRPLKQEKTAEKSSNRA